MKLSVKDIVAMMPMSGQWLDSKGKDCYNKSRANETGWTTEPSRVTRRLNAIMPPEGSQEQIMKPGVSPLLIDPENGAEVARLIDQHYLLTKYMGGLFPQDVDTTHLSRVLDLACGPGGWVQDVAFAYQDIEVIGVDNCQSILNYARSLAGVQGLDNTSFVSMDIRQPLNFDENSFDFIRASLLASVLLPAEWSSLLAECKRILRPGGILWLVETEWPLTNSTAVQQLGRIVVEALLRIGQSYTSDGQHSCTIAALVPFLHAGKLMQIRNQTYEVPLTSSPIGLHPIIELLRITLYLMEPFLLQWEVTTRAEFDALLRQMELEAISHNFRGTLCIGEAWGKKAG
jgi:SAM-dependent methyltransferase